MKQRVLLGVTGSIAAYKSADIVRLLIKKGREVKVVATKAALKFIGEVTLRTLSRNPVVHEMFPEGDDWEPKHISLADWPDVFVIAPCSANVIAKLAHGIADDILTCTALACIKPLIVVPAMNEKMLDHPATQANIKILQERGVKVLDVDSGDLACGVKGRGRMQDPEDIVNEIGVMFTQEGK